MEIGIGLPLTNHGVNREQLLGWARRAEERGFSSLGTIDRLVFSNWEPLTALTAAAAVTERIGLVTDILLAPLRGNGAVLAKQAATLDALSEGRVTLGIGVGGREDDFEAAGVPFEGRGRRVDAMLAEMKEIWAGEERGFAGAIGPAPAREGGPELLIGGYVGVSARRTAQFGEGFTMGGGTPEALAELGAGVKEAWAQAGRKGQPRLMALCYFSLGDKARENADRYLKHYYAAMGPEVADGIAATRRSTRRRRGDTATRSPGRAPTS